MSGVKFIGSILVSIVWTTGCQSWAGSCPELLGNSNKTFDAKFLREGISHIDQTLQSMIVNSDLRPIEELGHGFTGTVYKVKYNNEFYALKFMGKPSKTNFESVVIQKVLGDLGFAPKVIGVLLPEQIEEWSKSYGAQFGRKGIPRLGILMDLTETRFLSPSKKPPGSQEKIKITHQEYVQALQRIRSIAEAIHFLGIRTIDPDATITPGKGYQLVDLNEFRLWKESEDGPMVSVDAIYESFKRADLDDSPFVEIVPE